MSHERTKVLTAVQQHHPDHPQSGWSITVLDRKGRLFARFFGTSKKSVERRVRDCIGPSTLGDDEGTSP